MKCTILSIKNTFELTATSADYVKNLIALARSANVSLLHILQDLGLPIEIIEEKVPLNLVDFFRIQERLSIEIRDESLLMSTRPLLLGTTDHVLASLQSKETILMLSSSWQHHTILSIVANIIELNCEIRT